MKNKRSKKTGYRPKTALQRVRSQCVKGKEALHCIGRRRQKLLYHTIHHRGC